MSNFERQFLPDDVYRAGWKIALYSHPLEFDKDMHPIASQVTIGLWRNDSDIGVVQTEGRGEDIEATVRDAISRVN